MSILLVSFSTEFFRDGAMGKGGTKFAWDRYCGGFEVLFYSCWVDILKCDLIQLTAAGAGRKTWVCLALNFLRFELYFALNQDQASS